MTRSNTLGIVAAACLFAIIIADLTYGAVNGRESLLTWTGLLFGVLALYALFNERIHKIAFTKSGVSIEQFENAVNTAVNLGAAAAVDKTSSEAELRRIATTIKQAARTEVADRLVRKRVMWVDDQPQNNEYGINALRSQNIEVVTCKSTREALEEIKKQGFDAIITDQLRHEDGIRKDEAGYELIRALRDSGIKAPVILSTAFANNEDARRRGFFAATNTQSGVFELVLKAIHEA